MVKTTTTPTVNSPSGGIPLEKKFAKKIALQFNRAQKTIAAHRKCAVALRKLQSEDAKIFFEQFFRMIRPVLLVFKREPSVERLVQFVIQYTSNAERISSEEETTTKIQRRNSGLIVDKMDDMTQKFCFDIIRDLLQYAHAKDKAIRFRVCQIVAGLINLMPEEIEIDDDLCEQLLDTFVCRLKDKVPTVRQQAVCILARIHNALDPDDEITKEYKRLMSSDSNKDVRKEVVKCILPSKYTLSSIVERTRDVKEDVRRAAYEKLFTDCPLKKLAIAERVSILKNGLKDRSPSVQESCVALLALQWLGQQMNNDIIELLKAMDVENYTETSELVLDALFSYKSSDMKQYIWGRQVDQNNLTPEEALYWRVKIQYLIKQEKDEELEETLPNATDFCAIIAKHYKECHEFITKQCLIIAKHLDFCDEVGRKNIHIILKHMIMVFQQPDNHVTEIIEALKVVVPSDQEFRTTIQECVEPLRVLAVEIETNPAPSDGEKKQKEELQANVKKYKSKLRRLKKEKLRLKTEITEAEDENDIAEIQEDLEKVNERISDIKSALEELEEELASAETLKKDVMVWIRTICVLREVNKLSSPESVFRLLEDSNFLKSIVIPCTIHQNVHVRDAALTVLGQFCALHLPFAQKYVNLFTNALNDNKEETCIHRTCLATCFDLVQLHSFGTIYEKCDDEEKEQCICELIATFKELMFEKNASEVATVAIEGCCKLIIFNKLQEHHVLEIISNMIIALFDPSTQQFIQMKQCLSMFLPAFAFASVKNMNRVTKIALPTLHRVATNFDNINLLQVGQFLIYLTDRTHLKKAPADLASVKPHSELALQLAYEVLVHRNKECNTYCKLFAHFSEFDDTDFVRKLSMIIAKAKSKISNRITSRILEKFEETLKARLNSDADEEMEDQTDGSKKEDLESEIKKEKNVYKEFRESFIESLSNEEMLTARFFEIAGVPVEEVQPPVVENPTPEKRCDDEMEDASVASAPSPQEQGPVVSSQTSQSPRSFVTPVKARTPSRLSITTPIKTPVRTPARYNDESLIFDDEEIQIQYSPRSTSIARRMSSIGKLEEAYYPSDSDSEVGALELSGEISSDEDEDDHAPATPNQRRQTVLNRELDDLINEIPLGEDEVDSDEEMKDA